MNTDSIS